MFFLASSYFSLGLGAKLGAINLLGLCVRGRRCLSFFNMSQKRHRDDGGCTGE